MRLLYKLGIVGAACVIIIWSFGFDTGKIIIAAIGGATALYLVYSWLRPYLDKTASDF